MPPPGPASAQPREEAVAAALHHAAVGLLRRLRAEDVAMGLGTARASALSVLVFGGPRTVGALAAIEQVRPPTMTRLLDRLERDGLVARRRLEDDRRSVEARATPKGVRLLEAGRARRVRVLAADLRGLPPAELATLEQAARILAGLQARGP